MGLALISPISWPSVSEVLISGDRHMEGLAGPLISSLLNTAGVLVKACTESVPDVLDALIGEEASGSMLVWRDCRTEGVCGDSNPRKKAAYIAFSIS